MVSIAGSGNLYSVGHLPLSGSGNLYISGLAASSGNMNLFMQNPSGVHRGRDLFIEGKFPNALANAYRTAYALGHLPSSGDMNLFVQNPTGPAAYMGIHLQAGEKASGTLPLFMYSTTNSGQYETIPLYLSQLEEPSGYVADSGLILTIAQTGSSLNESLNLFTKVSEAIYTAEGSGVKNDISLYTAGPIVASSVKEGTTEIKGNTAVFTDGSIGVSLYLEGQPLHSGIMNLFIARDIENDVHNPNIDLYVAAPAYTDSGNISLVSQGYLASTGSMDFAIPNTKDSLTANINLYTHGI